MQRSWIVIPGTQYCGAFGDSFNVSNISWSDCLWFQDNLSLWKRIRGGGNGSKPRSACFLWSFLARSYILYILHLPLKFVLSRSLNTLWTQKHHHAECNFIHDRAMIPSLLAMPLRSYIRQFTFWSWSPHVAARMLLNPSFACWKADWTH